MNEIIRETENHTLFKSIGGNIYIENQNGDVALMASSGNPNHEELMRSWAETATDSGMAAMFAENFEENKMKRTDKPRVIVDSATADAIVKLNKAIHKLAEDVYKKMNQETKNVDINK